MSKLLVLTFADKVLTEENYLKKSCKQNGLTLEVLLKSPWTQNAIKLQMLFEFVKKADDQLLLLVVDALDVMVFENEQEIIDKFNKQEADILFSGESNFMFKEPAKWFSFLMKYPTQPSIYQFLNSGSYMGTVRHIRTMLESIQTWYHIDLYNDHQLIQLKSDQYLLHKFYNDQFYHPQKKMTLKIDHQQKILGCTGGRYTVVKLPDLSKWQAFLFFILERNLLKLFNLHAFQDLSKDFIKSEGRFYNTKTKEFSSVMHFPGTWDRFEKVVDKFKEKKSPFKLKRILALMVSLISYPISAFSGIVLSIILLFKKSKAQ